MEGAKGPEAAPPNGSFRETSRFSVLVIAVGIVIGTGIVSVLAQQRTIKTRNWVIHTYEVRHQISRLEAARADRRAAAFALLLQEDPGDTRKFEEQVERVNQSLESLRSLVQDNSRQLARVDQISKLLYEQAGQLKSCLTSPNCAKTSISGSFFASLESRTTQIDKLTAEMAREEDDLLRGRLQTWNMMFRRIVITVAVALALAIFLLFYGFRLLTSEVNSRKKMEDLARENTESYRALSARILELQDLERRKIARELHDSVGQFLAALKLSLSKLASGKVASSATAEWLPETIEMTDRALTEIRTISHLLHPPLLDELGFESTAKGYAEEFSKRSGIRLNLHIEAVADRLPAGIELALFRVLQESLTNVYHHAGARNVDVRVTFLDGKMTMKVSDDGRGIPDRILQQIQSGAAAGIGLSGMRERLSELRGILEVESSPAGTTISATLPTTLSESN